MQKKRDIQVRVGCSTSPPLILRDAPKAILKKLCKTVTTITHPRVVTVPEATGLSNSWPLFPPLWRVSKKNRFHVFLQSHSISLRGLMELIRGSAVLTRQLKIYRWGIALHASALKGRERDSTSPGDLTSLEASYSLLQFNINMITCDRDWAVEKWKWERNNSGRFWIFASSKSIC